jgi:MacB-like periplasmic core domain
MIIKSLLAVVWRHVLGSFPPGRSDPLPVQSWYRVAVREETTDMAILIAHDLRYAVRLLLKTPSVSLIAVLTLALGIGANNAIFSVVHALLFAPLPYAQPDRIVGVWQDMHARGAPEREWTMPGNCFDWTRDRDTFGGLAAVTGLPSRLTGTNPPESLSGEQVTHTQFEVLGVRPALGRTVTAREDVPDATRVIVLPHGLWPWPFG